MLAQPGNRPRLDTNCGWADFMMWSPECRPGSGMFVLVRSRHFAAVSTGRHISDFSPFFSAQEW